MKLKTNLVLVLAMVASTGTFAQNAAPKPVTPAPKELTATRVNKPIKIDGLIDDEAWKTAPAMTDLTEFRPTVDAVEKPETKTVAYLLYDDEGIYFGGFCYERTKDSIAKELIGRDGFGSNDYIGLIFDTYYDKQNGFEFSGMSALLSVMNRSTMIFLKPGKQAMFFADGLITSWMPGLKPTIPKNIKCTVS